MIPAFEKMYAEFSNYKRSISTYGTILLNRDATKMALCRVYKGKSWTLPGGKVNQDENGKDAANRETYEETGFDPACELGLCGVWFEQRGRGEIVEELEEELEEATEGEDTKLLPWQPLQDSDKLVYTESDTKKRRTCYVCRGVPENFLFAPVARKEISEVSWHELTDLPKHTFAVLPFLAQLRKWIKRDNRKRGIENRGSSRAGSRMRPQPNTASAHKTGSIAKQVQTPRSYDINDSFGLTPFFSDDGDAPWGDGEILKKAENTNQQESSTKPKKEKKEKKRNNSRTKKSRSNSRSSREVSAADPLVESALASPGDPNRWTEDEMFATNEHILGRKITYDGNPHDFAEKGFAVGGKGESGRVDPHAFRVVGGSFMNSGGAGVLSAPPDLSRLQPLMNNAQQRLRSGSKGSAVSGLSASDAGGEDDGLGLTPFFSNNGKAPWEEYGVALGGMLPPVPAAANAGLDDQVINKQDATPSLLVSSVHSSVLGQSNSKGLALLSKLRQGTPANDEGDPPSSMALTLAKGIEDKNTSKTSEKDKKTKSEKNSANDRSKTRIAATESSTAVENWFMTDKQITAKSQNEKLSILPPPMSLSSAKQPKQPPAKEVAVEAQSDGIPGNIGNHMAWMKRWVQQLPQSGPTRAFGDFRLDIQL